MIRGMKMPTLEQVYELLDDSRYADAKAPDHEAYNGMANRLHRFHIGPERWPPPEPFQLGRPLAPQLPVGAGGINLPNDVADLSDGLLSLGGLGLSGWLPRTTAPNSRLNAAIVGFQRLNNLKPDGLVNPDGPTIKVLNGYLPLPAGPETMARAPMVEAAVLNESPATLTGRDITARGMGDEALARSRAEEARYEADMEAERRADDPFGDLLGGNQRRYQRNHIDDMLDEQSAEGRAQLDREALAGLDPNSLMTKLSDHSRGQAVFSPMGVPGKAFRAAIVAAERGKLDDDTGIAFGMYQLKIIGLEDIGVMDKNGEWTCELDVCTKERFLASKELQDRALTAYMRNTQKYLRDAGNLDVFDYLRQKIIGIFDPTKPITITPVGLMAAAHAEGHGKVRAFIKHQKKNGWVSDFDDLDEETRGRYLRIETRLRKFENVQYND